MPPFRVLCSGNDPLSVKADISSGVATVGEIILFLRPLLSSVLQAVMASVTEEPSAGRGFFPEGSAASLTGEGALSAGLLPPLTSGAAAAAIGAAAWAVSRRDRYESRSLNNRAAFLKSEYF